MHGLNVLWRQQEAIVLRVRETAGGAVIEANGAELARVLPGDARGRPVLAVAHDWVEQIDLVFRDNGRAVSVSR